MVRGTRFLSFTIPQCQGLVVPSNQGSGAIFINKCVSFGHFTLVEATEFEKKSSVTISAYFYIHLHILNSHPRWERLS
jgi:hypothetical protein